MTNRNARRLVSHVGHVLKYIAESEDVPNTGFPTKVEYKFNEGKAYVYLPARVERTGNGWERLFSYGFVDGLSRLSDKEGISYNIGLTDNLELHVQIFV